MNLFRKIMTQIHTRSKEYLRSLYTDRTDRPLADETVFYYRDIFFSFTGTGFRTPQRVSLYIWVPGRLLGCEKEKTWERVPCEDWLLRNLSGPVNDLAKTLLNDHKDSREKPQFSMQEAGSAVRRRSGCLYDESREAFRLRVAFVFPLIGGHSVNGKSGFKGVKILLDTLCDILEGADRESLREQEGLYRRQQDIRSFLGNNNLAAFVADGSILPRRGDTQAPLEGAVPFQSPPGLRVTIPFRDGTSLTGMGLRQGITVITGGGYGGKSTLLDALEQGIYFHVKGDGREYVITDETACKIYAEDGRYVQPTDLSPFFSFLPGIAGTHAFSTMHASGSVSQAANIVEAVYGGSRCLLIDEDTSAANFMIRDQFMRRLVLKEPIIPYTDRIRELRRMGVSTVLVIGGSSEYLTYGDCILLLEDYQVSEITSQARKLLPCKEEPDRENPQDSPHIWTIRKSLPIELQCGNQVLGCTVLFDHGRRIRIGEMSTDVTFLTALDTKEQLYTLAWLVDKLLTRERSREEDLKICCEELVRTLFEDSFDAVPAAGHKYELWLEKIRPLDLLMAAARLTIE